LRRFADQLVHEQLDRCINHQQLNSREIARLEE
jgi:exoribonuclease R